MRHIKTYKNKKFQIGGYVATESAAGQIVNACIINGSQYWAVSFFKGDPLQWYGPTEHAKLKCIGFVQFKKFIPKISIEINGNL